MPSKLVVNFPQIDASHVIIKALESARLLLKDPVVAQSCDNPVLACSSGYYAVTAHLADIAVKERCTKWFKVVSEYDKEFMSLYDTFNRAFVNHMLCCRVFDAIDIYSDLGMTLEKRELARRALKDPKYDFCKLDNGVDASGHRKYLESVAIGEE